MVLLDLGLPDLDGTEVIVGMRGWTHVPIIVLSARTESTDKVDALDVGADDYVRNNGTGSIASGGVLGYRAVNGQHV